MTQLSFVPEPALPAIRVVSDYGIVAATATAPHHVRCENGEEYVVKGTVFTPDDPRVAANELIAVRLADHLALPTLDHRLVVFKDEVLFASHYMLKGSWFDWID